MSRFAFNPDLDLEALSECWEPGGRLHVPNILTLETADLLEEALATETDWIRSVTMRSGTFHVPLKGNEPQTETHRKWLARALVDGEAPDKRPPSAERAPGPRTQLAGECLDLGAHQLVQGVLVARLLPAGEERPGPRVGVTQAADTQRIYCQASRFVNGQVLTEHTDHGGGKRLVAHVFNLTRTWNPDWGGLLLFYDEQGHVSRGFTPGFNCLNLFRTPQSHAVTQIAPYAPHPRLAISGWLMG